MAGGDFRLDKRIHMRRGLEGLGVCGLEGAERVNDSVYSTVFIYLFFFLLFLATLTSNSTLPHTLPIPTLCLSPLGLDC